VMTDPCYQSTRTERAADRNIETGLEAQGSYLADGNLSFARS
jgi:hypothetical protein